MQYHGFAAVSIREELRCTPSPGRQAVAARFAVALRRLGATAEDLDYIRF